MNLDPQDENLDESEANTGRSIRRPRRRAVEED